MWNQLSSYIKRSAELGEFRKNRRTFNLINLRASCKCNLCICYGFYYYLDLFMYFFIFYFFLWVLRFWLIQWDAGGCCFEYFLHINNPLKYNNFYLPLCINDIFKLFLLKCIIIYFNLLSCVSYLSLWLGWSRQPHPTYWHKSRENDLRERIPHTWPSFHENYFQSILGSVLYCVVISRTPPYWSVRVASCNFKRTWRVIHFTADHAQQAIQYAVQTWYYFRRRVKRFLREIWSE